MSWRWVLITLAIGCRSPKQAAAPQPVDDHAIVRIDGEVAVSVADVEHQLEQQPGLRARLASREQRQDFLERSLLQQELLAREARARGYDKSPEVQRVLKQVLVSHLVAKELDARLKPADIPESDVQAYYREHSVEFNRPEEVRVSQIVAKERGQARRAAAELKALPRGDNATLAALVAKHSIDADTRARGGDLGFLSRATTRLPRAVVDAAFALREPGDVSPPVASDQGFHVLILAQRHPGAARTYQEAKDEIRQRLYRSKWSSEMDKLVSELRGKAKVELLDDRLANLAATQRQ
jgi:peptidyl-prolyl cis-trans isomerase C